MVVHASSALSALAATRSLAPMILPDYPGGPLGLTVFQGRNIVSDPIPPTSDRNVLIINSGGDCRGYQDINCGAFHELKRLGYRVFGSLNGPAGVTNPRPQIIELTPDLMKASCQEEELLLATGGRKKGPFDEIEGFAKGEPMANFLRNIGPYQGGLLFVGGNGTLHMVERLHRETGIEKIVFAGASMDGDIPGLDRSIGMFSALEYAVGAVRSVRRTAASCNKVHIVQTMGGNSGRFPLDVCKTAGENALIIPEIGVIHLMDAIYPKLFKTLMENRGAVLVIGEKGRYKPRHRDPVQFEPQKGLQNSIVVATLAETIQEEMGEIAREEFPHLPVETRTTVLGHVQRQPETLSATDVNLGLDVGHRLAAALVSGHYASMVPTLDGPLISLAHAVSHKAHLEMEERVRTLYRRYFG